LSLLLLLFVVEKDSKTAGQIGSLKSFPTVNLYLDIVHKKSKTHRIKSASAIEYLIKKMSLKLVQQLSHIKKKDLHVLQLFI